jgi:hypothetical protein
MPPAPTPVKPMQSCKATKHDMDWNRMYVQLKNWMETSDRTSPPTAKEHPELSKWIYNQRNRFKSKSELGEMTEQYQKRLNLLKEIGINILDEVVQSKIRPRKSERTAHTSEEKWVARFELLKQWMLVNRSIPTRKENELLSRWLTSQRMLLNNQLAPGKNVSLKSQKRYELLKNIGVDVLVKNVKQLSPTTDSFGWFQKVVRYRERKMTDTEKKIDQMHLKQLHDYLAPFMGRQETLEANGRPGWNINENYSSLVHYTWSCLKVGDIDYRDCKRCSPAYSMKHVLSYLVDPYVHTQGPITPTATFEKGTSPFFSYESYRNSETDEHLNGFLATLPEWLISLWKKDRYFTMEELVELVHADDNKWFDQYMVTTHGTNPNMGGEIITKTAQPNARRLLLTSEIHGKKYSEYWKCDVEEGYGYSLGSVGKNWTGLRCLRDYPHLSDFALAVWKVVHPHLDPVSQQCPFNSITLMLYLGCVHAKVNPHQDNALNSSMVSPEDNSQLLGSSVMIISLFDPMRFLFTPKTSQKERLPPPSGEFLTEHASVYILKCDDDSKWKHYAKFPDGRNLRGMAGQRVRLAIVCRHVGRRTKMFCERQDWRRYREIHHRIEGTLAKQFPDSEEMREVFMVHTKRSKQRMKHEQLQRKNNEKQPMKRKKTIKRKITKRHNRVKKTMSNSKQSSK